MALKNYLGLFFVGIFLLSASHSFASSASSIFASIDDVNARVLLIGDTNHKLESIRQAAAFGLKEIKAADPSFDCLFVEYDERLQPALDLYSKTPNANFKQVLTEYINKFQPSMAALEYPSLPNEDIFREAKIQSIKVFAADMDFSGAAGDAAIEATKAYANDPKNPVTISNYALKTLQERNLILAKNVARRFQDKSCHRSIVFFGNRHMVNFEFLGVPTIPTRDYLMTMGLKSIVSRVVRLDCEKVPTANRKSCEKVKSNLNTSPIFVPSEALGTNIGESFFILAK